MARTKGTREKDIWKRDALIVRQFHKGIGVKDIAKHWGLSSGAVYAILSRRSSK